MYSGCKTSYLANLIGQKDRKKNVDQMSQSKADKRTEANRMSSEPSFFNMEIFSIITFNCISMESLQTQPYLFIGGSIKLQIGSSEIWLGIWSEWLNHWLCVWSGVRMCARVCMYFHRESIFADKCHMSTIRSDIRVWYRISIQGTVKFCSAVRCIGLASYIRYGLMDAFR